MNPDLTPLFDFLAKIVHTEYKVSEETVQDITPAEINTVIGMTEALEIKPEKKAALLKNELKYIFTSKEEFEAFNEKGDYTDTEGMEILINRFQVDAERTRIFLELRDRDWEAEPTYMELDF